MADIRWSSSQRNRPPFQVRNYLLQDEKILDSQRLAAVMADQEGKVDYRAEHSPQKQTSQCVWEDQWAYASVKTLKYELQVP